MIRGWLRGNAQPQDAGAPVQLISFSADSKRFEIGAEALDVLRKINTPVAVVAVSGRARQGKSFILNQLLGRSTGFQVGPTIRPCTKGLWLWSSPIKRTAADGSTYHLLLLDTEGIDAADQTGEYSTKIFSLAVLLSSLFVYNQMGGIDEASLDRLSLVTEVTKHIRVRSAGSTGESAADLAAFTPSFLWLLRDFYLALEDDGVQVTPKDYLEHALRPTKGSDPGVTAKNRIRQSITTLFPDRECFCLVRPVSNEKQLQNLDALPPAQLRPEFREGLEKLTSLIFAKALPKQLGRQVLTGSVLAALTTAYVDAINGGAVPTITTAWQGVSEAESRRAADSALEAYVAAFRSDVAPEESALDAEHRRALQAGEKAFRAIAVGDEAVQEASLKRFHDQADARFKSLREGKLAQAALACEKLLNTASAEMNKVARQEGATMADLQTALQAFDRQYAATAAGPNKWRRHAEFMRDVYGAAVRDVAERSSQRARDEARDAAARAAQAEASLRQEEAKRTQLHTSAAALEARAARAEQQLADAQRQADAARGESRQLSARLASAEARLAEAQQSQVQHSGALRTERDAAQQQVRGLTRELSEAQHRWEGAEAEHTALSKRLAVLEAAKSQAEAQLQSALAERDAAVQGRQLAEASACTLQRQLQDAQAALQSPTLSPLPDTAPKAEPMVFETDSGVDPSGMTIAQIKAWLVDNDHEGKVWELSKGNAKKADWVALMRSVM